MKNHDRMLLGVCYWLSERFGVSVEGLRWVFIITAILGIGSPLIVYLILAVIKPREY